MTRIPLNTISLPVRPAQAKIPEEAMENLTIKESVDVSVSHNADADIDMKTVDASNDAEETSPTYQFHQYKVTDDWLNSEASPTSDSDEELTETFWCEKCRCEDWGEKACSCGSGEDENEYEGDDDTDEDEDMADSKTNWEDTAIRPEDPKSPVVTREQAGEENCGQAMQDSDIEDLRFRALIALDGNAFIELKAVKYIINNLSGAALLDAVRKATAPDERDRYALERLHRALKKNGVLQETGNEYRFETIVGALQYFPRTEEEAQERNILRNELRLMDGETRYNLLSPQILALSSDEKLQLGTEALEVMNGNRTTFFDEDEDENEF